MGLFDFFKLSEPYFKFLDGSTMTPKQFGAFLVTSAESQIQPLLELLFDHSKPGFELPLTQSVLEDPFPAKLVFLSFFLGSSLLYPIKALRIPDNILGEVFSGIQEELLKLKKPDGLQVHPSDLIEVNNLIDMFNQCIAEELATKIDRDTENPLTEPPKATMALLSAIVMQYNSGKESAVESCQKQGFYHKSYGQITKIVDEAQALPMYAIHQTQVKFVAA